MAFRMIAEMRLVLDASADLDSVSESSKERVTIRQRVFWSAYSWDK